MLTCIKKFVYIVFVEWMRYPSWPVGRVAHADDCKSSYIGSIPVPASKNLTFTAYYSGLAQR